MRVGRPLTLVGLVVVSSVGLAMGRVLLSEPPTRAPVIEPRSGRPLPAAPAIPAPPPAERETPSDAANAPAATLLEKSSIQTYLAQRGIGSTEDPAVVVDELLDRMTDDELRSAILEVTNLGASDLEGIRDLRDYSRRLVGIAMNGVLKNPAPESAPVPSVLFSPAVDEFGAPTELAGRFDGAPDQRIYAVFPTEGYTSDKVLVKWFRDEAPRPLIFELMESFPRMVTFGRYSINPGEPLSHVWISRQGRWARGAYIVEFYDPAEPLQKLAAGRFVISDDAASAAE